jgi:hypothetical protein
LPLSTASAASAGEGTPSEFAKLSSQGVQGGI